MLRLALTRPLLSRFSGHATRGAFLAWRGHGVNADGTPAISIPLSNTNLPVGLHVVARRDDDDDKLLRAARLIADVVS